MTSWYLIRTFSVQLNCASRSCLAQSCLTPVSFSRLFVDRLSVHPSISRKSHSAAITRVIPQLCQQQKSIESAGRHSYSKGKERGKEKKKGPVTINEAEMAELINVSRLKDELQKGIDNLKADYIKNLSLRSPFSVLESMPVMLDGEEYTLQEIAQLGKKGNQLIVVNLSSTPQAVKPVLKAMHDTGAGLNPQQDGTTIYITIPKVTREYRESLAKSAKIYFQKFKDHSRDIQNRYIREVKKKEKEVSSDLAFSVQQQIHSMEEQYVREAEKIMIAKQNELLGNKE